MSDWFGPKVVLSAPVRLVHFNVGRLPIKSTSWEKELERERQRHADDRNRAREAKRRKRQAAELVIPIPVGDLFSLGVIEEPF